jgi:neutral trehalase
VRDWYNVIFQVSKERHLDIDKEDISDELEDLDLSLMVVSEMKSLSKMAAELGEKEESKQWSAKADHVSNLINKYMWDDQSGFYYHVDKKNHSFHFMSRDLRRKEIIGFLPLWAGVASQKQAARLVDHLKNSEEFWRTYGVPTLSANDPFYSPYVDYCCKWNGPVWMLWDYLVYDGLRNYGYDNTAERLSDKMMLAVTTQLSRNHNFWESYSPDNTILDSPSNYIWDSILAKLLIERYRN